MHQRYKLSLYIHRLKANEEKKHKQIKDSISFQTRIKLGEEHHAQVIPVQLQGGRPPYLGNVKLGLEEEKQAPKPQQSLFSRYVRKLFPCLAMMVTFFL